MTTSRPRFSIVSAAYDVARYLPDFIASVEKQRFDLGRVEVVMVDDGSGDETLEVLRAWQERRPELVRVLTQENAGQGAARNAGMAAARGEWITFPDPDDVLGEEYLAKVDQFLADHPTTHLVATHRVLWREGPDGLEDTYQNHPLDTFFNFDRLVDLDVAESLFHGSAPAAFFDLDLIRRHELVFDTRIRPNFEDGHFSSLYLLHTEHARVGFLRSARYNYRKRADGSSSLQGSTQDHRRFTDVFEYGYLAILDSALRLRGEIPDWLQHFVCYELIGYLSSYENASVAVTSDPAILDAFHRNMAAALRHVDAARILARAEFPAAPHLRLVLEHGYAEEPWVDDRVGLDAIDRRQDLARARYYFTGEPPAESVVNAEIETGPRHAKTRDLEYYGRVLLRERILWVRVRPDLRIAIDHDWRVVDYREPGPRSVRVIPRQARQLVGDPSRRDRRRVRALDATPLRAETRKARKLAATRRAKETYGDAWVLMDRVHDAGDSGEVLFRYLRREHPEINAWFVLERGTPDWARLRREFGRRVVAHDTVQWRVLMAHCAVLLSSHSDQAIIRPVAQAEVGEQAWRFVFLQHGVIKDDLSAWLNKKPIDLMVTSSTQEYASIAGDGTTYTMTTKEAQLTGLPRFDRLLEVGSRYPAGKRDLVLVAPTWRRWLVQELLSHSQRRFLSEGALDSEFVRLWLDYLRSEELREACETRGLRLGLLPHPNLQALLQHIEMPDHVLPLRYDGEDVQEFFARARVLVTDYSSIAFNAAYLDRPVIYFQFDAERVLTGGHVGRGGYFEYARDGFGPVTATVSEAVAETVAALDRGPEPAPLYAERIAATFPLRDGRCCERVVAVARALFEPDDAEGKVPTPSRSEF